VHNIVFFVCACLCLCVCGTMSIRECVDYVWVRGTCVSTSMLAPSMLHVTVVHKFGLPNRHGIITCDGHLLHLRFDHKDDRIVYVWAQPVEDDAGAHEGYYCTIA